MKIEYYQFKDTNNVISTLDLRKRFILDSVKIAIVNKETIVAERVLPSSKYQTQRLTNLKIKLEEKNREQLVWVQFRHKSRLAILQADDYLSADYVYEFLTEKMKIHLTPIDPGRNNIREFLNQVNPLDVQVETWHGLQSIDELREARGDPILKFGLSSAEIEIDCQGKFTLKITLRYIDLSERATSSQRECAIELVEQYLVH